MIEAIKKEMVLAEMVVERGRQVVELTERVQELEKERDALLLRLRIEEDARHLAAVK